jgi:hypothetical protein
MTRHLRFSNSLYTLMLGGLLFGGVALAAGDGGPAAVLTVVAGDVDIHRGEQNINGSFGASLQDGDVVETGVDAEAAIVLESGQMLELGPGSRITISALPERSASTPMMAQVPDAISGNLSSFTHNPPGEEGLAALPTLRSGQEDGEPHPINPRNSLITPDETLFAWSEVEDVIEYRVMLTGPGELAGDHETSKTTWRAEKNFTPGEHWGWRVEAVTIDGGIVSDAVDFEVASKQKLIEFESLTAQLEPLLSSGEATSIDAGTYLLASYCRSAGFYNRAIGHFQALSGRHPDRKELHEELGFLYQAIGRNDKAAEEYRIALKE